MKKFAVFLCTVIMILGAAGVASATLYYENTTVTLSAWNSNQNEPGIFLHSFNWNRNGWKGTTYQFEYSLTPDQLDVFDDEGRGNVNVAANVVFNHPDWARFWDNDFAITRVAIAVETAAAPVPEPATLLLLGTGLVGMAAIGRKRKKSDKL